MKKYILIATALAGMMSCKGVKSSTETTELQMAWKEYNQAVQNAEEEFVNSKIFKLDSVHQAGAYELLSMLIAGNQDLIMTNPDFPNFRNMESPTRRIGIDNPDNYYRVANVWNPDGKHVYKITGNRGTTADFLVETFYGPDPKGAIAVLEDEQMNLDENGDFVIYLSKHRESHMQNWMELEQEDRILSLIVRSNHSEWDKERHGDVYIELEGTSGEPSPNTDMDMMAKKVRNAADIINRQGKFWPNFAWKMTLMPKNSLMKFKTTGEIGILSQKSSYGYWQLESDEALVVKLREVDAGYCGFQILNFWGSSPDWRNRQSSLSWGRDGKCQAFKSSDGYYYIVVSEKDPGIENWIDACGMKKGVMTLRIQSLRELGLDFKPETQVVKLSNLLEHLPEGTPKFSKDQRSEQLSSRQQHALDRYTYW
ncbi:hypothetical protein [Aureibacter tunicatorum]|uniref:DUF1214 domain-containing protein n=1 Tax=Aureibacter tunicatorum TaxID=866807 RepID=A0AAE4BUS0_9BACT|nr:hypothetical protein [Aureibacter tunicatorum]MDR6241063.1 hypothetical protein [Aureibacter tunicatorum]BDD03841.1 hypothetical protein AUTU_13240 [Aureibacter tunicatorum]